MRGNMSKIFKNMVPYWKTVLIVLVLLVIQAWCDLSLPAYTSDIIDVGIINNGVEHILPEAITTEQFQMAEFFMTEDEKELWENSYEEKDGRYECVVTDEKELDELDETLLLPILLNYQLSSMDESTLKESAAEQMGVDASALENVTVAQMLQGMGEEQIMAMRKSADAMLDTMGSSTVIHGNRICGCKR